MNFYTAAMSKTNYISLFLIVYFFMAACLASTPSEGYSVMLDRVKQVKRENNIAGLGLVIVDRKNTLYKTYSGIANREQNRPVNNDTVFRIGSITKTFTSLAILHLVEQGKIALNDNVSKHVKVLPFVNTYGATTPIQVAHLLEHTAGFRDMTQKEFDFKQPNWTLGQSLNYDPISRITNWEPNKYFSYSNSGAGIASLVIEQISQQPFEKFVEKQIFLPLELQDASFFLTDNIKSRLATGYDTDGETIIPYWNMLFRASGSINMRIDDMSKFIQLLLNYGKNSKSELIFTESSIRRLELPVTSLAARNGLTYGYGLGNYQWLRDGVLFHGHGGDADGFLAHYGYTRTNNLGYFIVINAFNTKALHKIRRIVETWLVQNVDAKSPPATYPLNRIRLDEIVGQYIPITNRFAWADHTIRKMLKVFYKQGEIYTQLGSQPPKQLIPVNEKHFRRIHQPIATVSILKDHAGATIFQSDLGNFRKI